MAKAKQRRTANAQPESPGEAWSKLTWDDLDEWAGARTVSRGRSYQRNGRVKHLCISESGTLLAWVHGGDRYAARVELDTTKRKRSGTDDFGVLLSGAFCLQACGGGDRRVSRGAFKLAPRCPA